MNDVIWVTQKYEAVHLANMSTKHLSNSIAMVFNHAVCESRPELIEGYYNRYLIPDLPDRVKMLPQMIKEFYKRTNALPWMERKIKYICGVIDMHGYAILDEGALEHANKAEQFEDYDDNFPHQDW